MLIALPAHQVSGLEGIMQAISKSAERVGFAGSVPLAALLITISNLGALGAWLAVSARLPFVAGLDRYLPEAFARVHPKWGTPYVALLVQAFCGVIFIVLSQAGTSVYGAYEVLVSMGIITYFIPYLFVFASLIRLQREPAGPGNDANSRRQARGDRARRAGIYDDAGHDRVFGDSRGGRATQISGRRKNCGPYGVAAGDWSAAVCLGKSRAAKIPA